MIEKVTTFERVTPAGDHDRIDRAVATECPIALEYSGVGYAVLMASPTELDDLAVGFALSERLIDDVSQILHTQIHEAENGYLIRAQLTPDRHHIIQARVRHRVTESSCGLCGIENLEQALRPLPQVATATPADHTALFAALNALPELQPGNLRTGSMHAAALCASDGTIRLVREDVGRHNAFDKLIGAMALENLGWDKGFALLSSRCSFELVEKAALAQCPLLVTVSAPTSLAIERARESGLALVVLARSDALLKTL